MPLTKTYEPKLIIDLVCVYYCHFIYRGKYILCSPCKYILDMYISVTHDVRLLPNGAVEWASGLEP